MKRYLPLLLLLITTTVFAAPPTRQNTYISGTTIRSDEVNEDFDDLFGYLSTGIDSIRTGGLDAITEIDTDLKTGSDQTLVTGSEGTANTLGKWNSDGDLVSTNMVESGTIVTVSGILSGQTFFIDNLKNCTEDLETNTAGQIICGTDSGGGGGDAVSIDGVAVTDPDFVSTGDIDFVDTSNTITANINAGSIIETDLDGDVAPTDGDWLQYDSTGTNFTWRSSSELLSDVGQNAGTDITADLEEEAHASEHSDGAADEITAENLATSCSDGQILEASSGGWTCGTDDVAAGGGGSTIAYDFILDPQNNAGLEWASYQNTWTSSAGDARFFTIDTGTTDVVVRGDGNVGIGTTDPSQVLDVSGTANATTLTEGGNAVYNSTETPGGELGGTWASPTIDDSVTVTGWALGASTATTPSANDNDTSLATTAYTQTELTAYASDTVTFTNKTFDANGTGNSLSNVETADIASASKSGADTTLITGTAGTSGNCVEWNGDGDIVDAGAACGTGSGTTPRYDELLDPGTHSGLDFGTFSNFWTATEADSEFFYINTGTTDVVIRSDGNVGIGTTDPAQVLDVAGNIAVSGTVDGVDIATRDHDAVTLAGTPDYLTLSGQQITRGTIDISDDTNLASGNGATVNGDTVDFDCSDVTDSGADDGVTCTTEDIVVTVGNDIDTTEIAAATLVTEAEGISSNDNDTTIPTSAAVKDYADSVGGGTDDQRLDEVGDPGTNAGFNFAAFTNSWTYTTGTANWTSTGASHFFTIGDNTVGQVLRADTTNGVVTIGEDKNSCVSADPCGSIPEGTLYYSCGGIMCFCDGAGVDIQTDNSTACTY